MGGDQSTGCSLMVALVSFQEIREKASSLSHPPAPVCSHMKTQRRRWPSANQQEGPHQNRLCQHPDPRLPAPGTGRSECLWFTSLPAWGALLGRPSRTKSLTDEVLLSATQPIRAKSRSQPALPSGDRQGFSSWADHTLRAPLALPSPRAWPPMETEVRVLWPPPR